MKGCRQPTVLRKRGKDSIGTRVPLMHVRDGTCPVGSPPGCRSGHASQPFNHSLTLWASHLNRRFNSSSLGCWWYGPYRFFLVNIIGP